MTEKLPAPEISWFENCYKQQGMKMDDSPLTWALRNWRVEPKSLLSREIHISDETLIESILEDKRLSGGSQVRFKIIKDLQEKLGFPKTVDYDVENRMIFWPFYRRVLVIWW